MRFYNYQSTLHRKNLSVILFIIIVIQLFIIYYVGHCLESLNHYQHHYGSAVISSPGSVEVFYKWATIPPKISFMSHTLTGDTIDISSGSNVHLKCTGQRPMVWIFPNNNNPVNFCLFGWFSIDFLSSLQQFEHNDQYHNLTVNFECDPSANQNDYSPTRCWSEVIIPAARFDMTGYYVCQYNVTNHSKSASLSNFIPIYQNVLSVQSSDQITPIATDLIDMVYIFVNDPHNLMVPFEGQLDFLFIALFQLQPATIPCRPTYSKAVVKLWKMQTKDKDLPTEIKPNSTLGISYNPKKGFYFDNARWDSDSNSLQCHFEVDGLKPLNTSISIHWSSMYKYNR